ncbi:MAG: CHAT domain-containing protein [Pyrinomonadaceae bacterium]
MHLQKTLGKFRFLRILCLALCAFSFAGTAVGQSPSADTSDRILLRPGTTLNREISGTQTHLYRIELAAGQSATVTAKEIGIDLSLRLRDADGNLIAAVDAQNSADDGESISFVAETAATFDLEVFSDVRKAGLSAYSITLSETRPATSDDKSLYQALRDHHEAIRILSGGSQAERAVELAARALEARELVLGSSHPLVGESLVVLGRSYAMKGDFAQAERTIDRALEIFEKSGGKESLRYTLGLFAIARVNFGRGEMKAAEAQMLQALAIFEKTRDGGGLRAVTVLSNLGLLYRTITDFRRAELTFRRAIDILEKLAGEDNPEGGNLRNNLGLMYYGAGDYANAEKELERSLAIFERLRGVENREGAIALNNLGLVAWRKGDYVKAEATWNRALKIFEKVNGPESDGVSNVLGNLGIIYKEYYQDFKKAEEAQKRSLAIIQKLSGENSLQAGTATASLALIYRSLGDVAQTESYALQADKIYERSIGPTHQNVVLNLAVLAQLSAMKGDLAGSLAYQKRIDAIDSAAIQTNLVIGSERQKIAFFGRLRNTDRGISFLVSLAPTNVEARDLVLTQILQRKGRVLDALSQNLTEFRKRGGEQDAALLTKLNDLTSEISKLSSQGRAKRSQAEFGSSLNALLAEREKVESEISRRTAGSYVPTKPIQLSAVRSAIPAGSALIEFAVFRPFEWNYDEAKEPYGDPHYIAFVVRSQGDIGWVDLGDAKAIDDAIGKLRSAFRDPSRSDVADLSRIVEQKVTAPLRKLAAGVNHLIISPDGELNLLPFEALVDEEQRYLAQRYSFTYVSSGRDLLRMRSAGSDSKELVIVSNPTFGMPADASSPLSNGERKPAVRQNRLITRSLSDTFFAPLSGTAREAAAIRTIFPEAKLLTGEDATETSLKQVRSPDILHIATHGFFLNNSAPASAEAKPSETLSENPLLRSGLAFAGANIRKGEKDDGILTGLEASGLDLWGTKLVVLSACDTGLGEIRNGEGVYGLRRSFALAGAESLVMSLWPVSDNVTRELMTGYYKNLKKGMGRGEALRQVRLEMIKQPDRRHPFYWASFIQSGEWANLDGKR